MNQQDFTKFKEQLSKRMNRFLGKALTELSIDEDTIVFKANGTHRIDLKQMMTEAGAKKYNISNIITPQPKLKNGVSSMTVSAWMNDNSKRIADLREYEDDHITAEMVVSSGLEICDVRYYSRPIKGIGLKPSEHSITMVIEFKNETKKNTTIVITMMMG